MKLYQSRIYTQINTVLEDHWYCFALTCACKYSLADNKRNRKCYCDRGIRYTL